MYNCKHCGFTSTDESYCRNPVCIYYGCRIAEESYGDARRMPPPLVRQDSHECRGRVERERRDYDDMKLERQHRQMDMAVNGRIHNQADMPEPPCNDSLMLGFSVVPFQRYKGIMPLEKSMMAGTVFADLYMPYTKKIIDRG